MQASIKQKCYTFMLLMGIVISHPGSTKTTSAAHQIPLKANYSSSAGLKGYVDASTGKIITNPMPTQRFDARLNASNPNAMAPLVMKSKEPQGGTIVYFGKQLHAGLHVKRDQEHHSAECITNHIHFPMQQKYTGPVL